MQHTTVYNLTPMYTYMHTARPARRTDHRSHDRLLTFAAGLACWLAALAVGILWAA